MRFALGFTIGVIVGPVVWRLAERSVPIEIKARTLDKVSDILVRTTNRLEDLQHEIQEEGER